MVFDLYDLEVAEVREVRLKAGASAPAGEAVPGTGAAVLTLRVPYASPQTRGGPAVRGSF
jgi:hypothetical protein